MHEAEARATIQRFLAMDAKGFIPADSMLGRLMAWCRWLAAGMCIIRDQDERLIPLKPNRAQIVIVATMLTMAAVNKPVRLVILKARKLGVTTLIESLQVFLGGHYDHQIACTLAHLSSSTDELFEITKRMAEHYTAIPTERLKRIVRFPLTSSKVWAHTAGGGNVGAGGTPSFMHLSERALWKANQKQTETAALNAVPSTPTSVIVYESTARGRESFYQAYEAAKAHLSEYEAIFIPWYYDERLVAPPVLAFSRTADERGVVERAKAEGIEVSDPQLQWRRNKIAEIGPRTFKQEYPSTPLEAVESAKGLVLPGLRECVVDTFPFDSADPNECVGGIDFGFHHPAAILTGYYVDDVLYVGGIWHGARTLARDRVAGLTDGHTYYCDPSGLQDREELEAASRGTLDSVCFEPAPRADGSLGSIVEAELQIVRTLIDNGRLKIHGAVCDQLILEADNYFYNDTTGKPDCTYADLWGHFDTLDALRYMAVGAVSRVPMVVYAPPASTSRRGGLKRF